MVSGWIWGRCCGNMVMACWKASLMSFGVVVCLVLRDD